MDLCLQNVCNSEIVQTNDLGEYKLERRQPAPMENLLAEGVGFEPTRALRPSGFQDRPDTRFPAPLLGSL